MGDGAHHELLDHLFRTEAGNLSARLARAFGPRHIALVDDVVQEALLRALRRWPFDGIPDNPRAWLYRVARNAALDQLRRGETFLRRRDELAAELDGLAEEPDAPAFDEELVDDQLALLFACCTPELSEPVRVTLTLKVACGFGVEEIAAGFLAPPATIAQRLVRAKKKLRGLETPPGIPPPEALPERLDAVLATIYLLFNEGYSASLGDELVRMDLCREALRLVRLLLKRADTALPEVAALAALLCLQASRLEARVDEEGHALTLAEQDRTRWDRQLIAEGFAHLAAAENPNGSPSRYHLEAAIAGVHAAAPSFGDVDWARIVGFYEVLESLARTPMTALNHAVAVGHARGADAGLRALDALPDTLANHPLLHAARAEFLEQLARMPEARRAWMRALARDLRPEQRRHIERRLGANPG